MAAMQPCRGKRMLLQRWKFCEQEEWKTALIQGITVKMYPFMLHSISLSIFASAVGPFGDFVSGFKKAFKKGVMEYLKDCQSQSQKRVTAQEQYIYTRRILWEMKTFRTKPEQIYSSIYKT